jgi:hypothetical protein
MFWGIADVKLIRVFCRTGILLSKFVCVPKWCTRASTGTGTIYVKYVACILYSRTGLKKPVPGAQHCQ